MSTENGWVTDSRGNRASIARWGSEAAARAALATLRNCTRCTDCTGCTDCTRCTRCTDCTYCTGCTYCTYCSGCTDCTGCTYCTYCTRCMYCNLSLPHHRLPVSDPRGYIWVAIAEGGEWRIRAGCRAFLIAEARAHWLAPDYQGPQDVRETVGTALDWIEAKACPS